MKKYSWFLFLALFFHHPSKGYGQVHYIPEALIVPEETLEEQGIIDGMDLYQIERYEGFDRTVRPQRQTEEPATDLESLNRWGAEANDFDSYQEEVNKSFIEWQKRQGILPRKY